MGTWAVIGGDRRQIAMLKGLRKRGISVSAWGIGEFSDSNDWQTVAKDANVILLPLPASDDGVRIRSPLQEGVGLRFLNLLNVLKSNTLILGGKLPPLWEEQAKQRGIRIYDYFLSEALQMYNALPTAEGAILLALDALPVTLDGCEVAVLGYGRIGALLAEKLCALGAKVTIYARKERDLAHARLRHCNAVAIEETDGLSSLCGLSDQCRIVFNTIPYVVVTESVLRCWRRDCVLMELASLPGGFDRSAVEKLSFQWILASALPGKYFPESAGMILADVLLTLVKDAERRIDF